MSGVRVLGDIGGPLRTTVDGGSPQWTPDPPDDEDFFPSDDGACAACSRAGHRSSWTEGFDLLQEVPHGGGGGGGARRSFGGFRRRMSPARLHVVSDVTRLRHRSSSGGRRYSDTTTADGLGAGQAQGQGQGQGHQGRLLRLSRDATQPTSGSVSDLRGGSTEADGGEESDVLPALGGASVVRPRSFTCPDDIKVMQRRTKIRLLHRPPTPTPGDELAAAAAVDGGLLAAALVRSCSLTGSEEIFIDNEEEEEEREDEEEEEDLPVISET